MIDRLLYVESYTWSNNLYPTAEKSLRADLKNQRDSYKREMKFYYTKQTESLAPFFNKFLHNQSVPVSCLKLQHFEI